MEHGYVYCLRFRSTQFYVGSSKNPVERKKQHKTSCFSKKPANRFMGFVWKKFGEPELYILSKVPLDLMLEEEQKFIDLVFGKEGCVNLNPKADKPMGFKNKKHSAEAKARLSAINKGRVVSDETRAKMSAFQKGKVISQEQRANHSTFMKGKKHSPETLAKISASGKGKIISEEQRAKISATLTGRKQSPETIAKLKGRVMSEEARAKMSACRKDKKAVVGTRENETIEFSSIAEASRFIGKHQSGITGVLRGKRQTCGGYSWTYK